RLDFLKKDYAQGFPAFCVFKVERVDKGYFESRLRIRKEHSQQDGFVHAGVIATMADHTAGYSAYTLVPDDHRILTIEFKINYLRPAIGEEIVCRSKVINSGRKIIISESEIYSLNGGEEKIVSKAIVTLMSVPMADLI
ncbi:MAG: PaaI family thioesterase, partial [Desulfobacterales bacterium]|nr:PaaI family thioesterase [Desulfobacterales bacterium]